MHIFFCDNFLVCYKLFPYSERSKGAVIKHCIILIVTISGKHTHQPGFVPIHSIIRLFGSPLGM